MSYLAGVAVVILGMAGLYHHVEYAGWVLLVGCIQVLGSD